MVAADRELEKRGNQIVTDFAPVESRVDHENQDAGEDEEQKAESYRPV